MLQFCSFIQCKCTFGEINVDLCYRFLRGLLTAPPGLHKNRKLHINSAPTTGQPTTNRAQSNLFKLPMCEGGNRKVTFRASIHTAYRDRKIKENQNAFLERIEIIPTDKDYLSQDEVICLASTPCSASALNVRFCSLV